MMASACTLCVSPLLGKSFNRWKMTKPECEPYGNERQLVALVELFLLFEMASGEVLSMTCACPICVDHITQYTGVPNGDGQLVQGHAQYASEKEVRVLQRQGETACIYIYTHTCAHYMHISIPQVQESRDQVAITRIEAPSVVCRRRRDTLSLIYSNSTA